MKKLILVFLVCLALSMGVTAQASPLSNFEYDGLQRTYSLFVPEGTVTRLLFVLHPFGSSGTSMQYLTGMNTYAQQKGFAVVYPNAASYYWDEGRGHFNIGPEDFQADDVGFITALAEQLTSQLGIDSHEVYLSGIGNGAGLAYVAACTRPEAFKAVAIVSTLLWDYQANYCPEAQTAPINMLVLWGDKDPTYTFTDHEQTISNYNATVFGTVRSNQFWLERNECEMTERSNPVPNLDFYPCANETSFAFVTLENSGGQWPRKGEYQLNRYGVDASEIIANYITGETDWYNAAVQSESSQETPRTWVLYVPSSYDPSSPTPLVVLMHGKSGNGYSQAYTSDFRTVAEREGVIAVFPDGLNNEWNYIRYMPDYEGIGPYDDDAFITGLIDDLSLELNIDQSRVYATGYSNGGFMAQRLACTQSERFAAVASVAATGAYGLPQFCDGTPPKPILYIHGTADPIVPWDGQESQAADGSVFYISAPMSRTMGFWAEHNGCESDMTTRDLEQHSELSQTRVLRVTGCPSNGQIIVYMVIGGGHVWPGIRPTPDFLGYSSTDFNASDVIWNFFDQYALEN